MLTGEDTWDNTYKDIFEDLVAQRNPIKYASVAMNELLKADDQSGGTFTKTRPTEYLESHSVKIWAWTFDDWSFKAPMQGNKGTAHGFSGQDDKWKWYHGDCLSEGEFHQIVYKDADDLLILHALFEVAGVDGVFSDWAATVSAYVHCVDKRPDFESCAAEKADKSGGQLCRADEASYVTRLDSKVGFMRCSEFTTKHIQQSSAAPCATVQITSKIATSVPLF
jgi:hypothetical protein